MLPLWVLLRKIIIAVQPRTISLDVDCAFHPVVSRVTGNIGNKWFSVGKSHLACVLLFPLQDPHTVAILHLPVLTIEPLCWIAVVKQWIFHDVSFVCFHNFHIYHKPYPCGLFDHPHQGNVRKIPVLYAHQMTARRTQVVAVDAIPETNLHQADNIALEAEMVSSRPSTTLGRITRLGRIPMPAAYSMRTSWRDRSGLPASRATRRISSGRPSAHAFATASPKPPARSMCRGPARRPVVDRRRHIPTWLFRWHQPLRSVACLRKNRTPRYCGYAWLAWHLQSHACIREQAVLLVAHPGPAICRHDHVRLIVNKPLP